ncbi:Uncharacterised protein [Salmonella enterica subsp. enterica]|uniref:Uncharacterized protein n=1 Tax=Salmonella enterica I TaxID=59201 RepID=A0A379WX60_SALET|nr:Uncharacterised protein [Salmonella enterica subsp. enterica]
MSKTDIYLFPQEQRVLFYNCFQRFADIGQTANRLHASSFQRGEFFIRGAFTTGNDGASVAHTLAFRRGNTRDIANNRLGHVVFNVSRRFFFCATADLTDHHDRFSLRIFLEQFQNVDEVRAGIGSPPIPTQVDWPKP